MDELLRTLPPRLIAICAIVIGLIVILLSDPPKTVCDTQLEVFRESQKSFLYSNQKKEVTFRPGVEKAVEACKMHPGPGGCYELFDQMKRVADDLRNIPQACAADAGGVAEIRRALWQTLELMVLLAWGDKPPLTYVQRYGWLDSSDVALFCRLKHQAIAFYGNEEWQAFRVRVSRKFPDATTLSPEQIWQRSLLSTTCENFR